MFNLNEYSHSNSISVSNIGNNYEEKILNKSFDENSFVYNQNLNIQSLNESNYFQPELNDIYEEENEYFKNIFSNNYKEKDEITPNQDNMSIYNINNVQNNLNPEYFALTKKLGRKTKKSGLTGLHDKYVENNRVRKVKVILSTTLFNKINSEFKKNPISINIDRKENEIKELLKIGQEQVINTNVNYNIKLLNTHLKDFYSVDISTKFKKYPHNYNKLVIDQLYKEKKTNVTNILDKTILESLKYFRKDVDVFNNEKYSCLQGIEKDFENLPKNLKKEGHDDRYINKVIHLINNFEQIYFKKLPRDKMNKGEDFKTKNTDVTSSKFKNEKLYYY